ncbi:MAG: hypothetical protein RLZZ626_476 [Actinomycetota bacterium]
MARVIELERVSFGYKERADYILRDVSIRCCAGEITLVCGATGSGKSTLLNVMAGLAPRFSGGFLSGGVRVDGVEPNQRSIGGQPNLIGFVNQQAEGGFVAETVEEELAFALEQIGVSPVEMREKVAATAALVGLEGLLGRPVELLSGGQQQRLAIGSAIIAGPRVLLLDEPTSELDDSGAQMLIDLLRSLARDRGIAVVIAEHHLDRLVEQVDAIAILRSGGSLELHDPVSGASVAFDLQLMAGNANLEPNRGSTQRPPDGVNALSVSRAVAGYKNQPVLNGLSLELSRSDAIGIVGANGSGKSTLLAAIVGELKLQSGEITTAGSVRLVPQNATDLLYLESVEAELANANIRVSGSASSLSPAAEMLARWLVEVDGKAHPRDLSSGQQLALALAIQLSSGADILLLDEPTRGLDFRAKTQLAETLNRLKSLGHSLVIASHDLWFLNQVADRMVSLDAPTV